MNSSTVVKEGAPCPRSLTTFHTPKLHPTTRAIMSPRFTDSVWIVFGDTSSYRSSIFRERTSPRSNKGCPTSRLFCETWDFDRACLAAGDYLLTTSTTKLSGRIGGRGRGLPAVGAGRGPNCAVTV